MEFLSHLRDQDIRVWVEGDRLRYSAPSGLLTPALKAGLVQRKPEILAFLRRTTHTDLTIQPASRDAVFPLSLAQERFWILDQLDPGNPAYSIGRAFRLEGSLDVVALEHSLNEIVRRHESLRTNFILIDGQPIQTISPQLTLALPIVKLQGLSGDKQEDQIQQLISQEIRRPYDLEVDPLIRLKLIRIGEKEHILVVRLHHIISDGWSLIVFFRELSALYKAISKGESSPLPVLPIQYPDFTIWQRQWLEEEVIKDHLSYWKQQIIGSLPVLELPTDHPRPAVQTYRGASEYLLLPKDLTDSLKSLSGKEGVTLYITLLAAFNILLYRYSGQEDIILGSPISGRDFVDIESLIGLFLNTLILRTDLSDDLSFQYLLKKIRETVLGAFAHQVIPFEELLSEIQPERSLNHTPIFQAMFVFQDTSTLSLEMPDITVTNIKVKDGISMFDLSLVMNQVEQGLRAELIYNTDLFDVNTISRMLGHFQVLLESIVDNPNQAISQLSLLTEVEKHQLMVKWNDTKADYTKDNCIHQLFEDQVDQTPNAIAVAIEDQKLTYRELNQRANQLAHFLISSGVGPEMLVGICMERSLEMIVGILGILKAGGAYVPLDPTYPKERLAFMLDDTNAEILVTQQSLLDSLPDYQNRLVCLDTDWPTISREKNINPTTLVTNDNLVYVIYTSGSTGVPKGVMIQHESLVSYVETASTEFELTDKDRVLQFASISFDTAAEEIFPCLTRGATLILRSDEMLDSIEQFLQYCKEWELTVLDLPTAYWHELSLTLSNEMLDIPQSIRLVIIGGEKALWDRFEIWQTHVDHNVRLVNTYGPTESTIVATLSDLNGSAAVNNDIQDIPIGQPVSNVNIYILDEFMQVVPIGVPGEIHIGGIGLARGYLNQPELNAAKFVPNPFSDETDARLYKTGDFGRFLPDGNIQYLGRRDNQVKIRGYRIELGEIETRLRKHKAVRDVVVDAREDMIGGHRLVAYIVPNLEVEPNTKELRLFLQEILPQYMIPSVFETIDKLPLTPSGKVDHQNLPDPNGNKQLSNETLIYPRDELEYQITLIWEQILGIHNIGLNENFFDLGGHSMLAVRLVVQIEKVTGKKLPLITIYQAPTVELQAEVLRQEGWTASSKSLIMVQSGQKSLPQVFCIPGNLGNVFTDLADLARHLGPDQSFYGFQDGVHNPIYINELATQYIDELRKVQPEGPYHIAGVCSGGVVAFEMAQQLQEQGHEIRFLGLIEPSSPKNSNLRSPLKYLSSLLRRLVGQIGRQSRRFSELSLPEKGTYLQLKAKLLANEWGVIRYSPQSYPGKIHMFLASDTTKSTRSRQLLWEKYALEGATLHDIPGTHDQIVGANDTKVESEYMEVLANLIRPCIDEDNLNDK